MKKKYLLIFGLFLITNSYTQEKKFKPKVIVTENNIPQEFINSKSILFIFDVQGCMANYYNDLAKKIKKRFKKTDKEIAFNFLNNTTMEVEKIPTKYHSQKDFDLICRVTFKFNKSWENHLKQSYELYLDIEKDDTIKGSSKINVNSYQTILTQNKKLSKIIYRLFEK